MVCIIIKPKIYDKDKKDNYENKFIESNSKINKIVNQFIKKVCKKDIEAVEILDLIKEYAPKLWDVATKAVQKGELDDRPLYWARNKMQIYIKRSICYKGNFNLETSKIYKGTYLDTAITDFENKSRNYTGIDFSKASNKKKVLVTGFDPFQLDPKYYIFNQISVGSSTFNPAGISALALNNNKDLKEDDIFVQTCIFPVRYEDFDKGCVEDIIKRHINEVDAIITTSRNNTSWDIDQYAISYRGGFHCNNNIGNSKPLYNSSRFIPNTSSAIIETTLKNKIFGSTKKSITIGTETIVLDSTKSSTKGSGSNYLSNEVMYRATTVRGNDTKPVGHLHLKNLRDLKKQDVTVNIVKEVIKKTVQ